MLFLVIKCRAICHGSVLLSHVRLSGMALSVLLMELCAFKAEKDKMSDSQVHILAASSPSSVASSPQLPFSVIFEN